jgi:tRNA A37 threonylcarbamoyladenosine dehydratase
LPAQAAEQDGRTAFSYADRDAKKRWATGMATQGMLGGALGGVGSSIVGGLARGAVGKLWS